MSTFQKHTIQDRCKALTSIEVYELVLKSEIQRFPNSFWSEISELELRVLLIYFFEKNLSWSIEDIKNNIDIYIFPRHKLGGMLRIFDGSPFKVVNFTYPDKIKEWQLKCTPISYWTRDKCIQATKDILELEKWTDDDIRNKRIAPLFVKYKVTTIYITFFKGKPYTLINSIYPNKFKPWEIGRAPKHYWNIETGKLALKWMIEDKLKWSVADVKEKYCFKVIRKYKLEAMINIVFSCSLYKAINETYPDTFKEEDFTYVPMNYWTRDKAIKAIKAVLDKLSEEDIKQNVTVKFFIINKLRSPFHKYFRNSPFLVLNTIYPNRFVKTDFKTRSKRNKIYPDNQIK